MSLQEDSESITTYDGANSSLGKVPSITISDCETTWPALQLPSKYISSHGWQKRRHPEILTRLPPETTVSAKLQQILEWSLLPGSDWAHEPQCTPFSTAVLSREQEIQEQIQHDNDEGIHPYTGSSASLEHYEDAKSSATSIETADKSAWSHKLLQKIGFKTSTPTKQREPSVSPPTRECTSCFDDLPVKDLVQLESCRHDYCKPCLTTLITTTMMSESSFPPKCCLTPIPLKTILISLNSKQRAEYKVKSEEFSVPANERWYCPKPSCSKHMPFLRLKFDRNSNYHCPFCHQKICATCRGEAHARNAECPQDSNLESTLEVAEVEGWVRCYSCRILVEHTSGCRHMTCKCKAEFCYVCGARWPTCSCTERDADTKRANVRERRQRRDEALGAEAAEMARAIAEIEEMERREEEIRRLEEERIVREEQEMLEILEFQRREEEAARLAAEQLAEQEWLRTLRTSCEEDSQQMRKVLEQIIIYQKAALISQHEAELTAEEIKRENAKELIKKQLSKVLESMSKRYETQIEALVAKHETELCNLNSEQDEEEDSVFVQMQVRLRGKPNKEARTERVLEDLHKQHLEQREELRASHRDSLDKVRQSEIIDVEGIKRARRNDLSAAYAQEVQFKQCMGSRVGAERLYFNLVSQRRLAMLSLHCKIALDQVEQKIEPAGLQDWQAAKCEPTLPKTDDGAPGPSGIDRRYLRAGVQRKPVPGQEDVQQESAPRRSTHMSHNASELLPSTNPSAAGDINIVSNQRLPGSFPTDESLPEVVPMPPSEQARPLALNSTSRTSSATSSIWRSGSHSEDQTVLPCVAGLTAGLAMALVSQPQSLEKRNSTAATIISVESDERGSVVLTGKRSKWLFGRKSKELSPEEIRQRMRNAVGDAF